VDALLDNTHAHAVQLKNDTAPLFIAQNQDNEVLIYTMRKLNFTVPEKLFMERQQDRVLVYDCQHRIVGHIQPIAEPIVKNAKSCFFSLTSVGFIKSHHRVVTSLSTPENTAKAFDFFKPVVGFHGDFSSDAALACLVFKRTAAACGVRFIRSGKLDDSQSGVLLYSNDDEFISAFKSAVESQVALPRLIADNTLFTQVGSKLAYVDKAMIDWDCPAVAGTSGYREYCAAALKRIKIQPLYIS
jgi:hypothetical protein